jgi:hypothetical protein
LDIPASPPFVTPSEWDRRATAAAAAQATPPPPVPVVHVDPGARRTAPAAGAAGGAAAAITTTPPTDRGAAVVRRPYPTTAVANLQARSQRLNPVFIRATQAQRWLMRVERKNAASAAALPDDVRAARDNLTAQMQAAARGLQSSPDADFDAALKALDDTTSVIEKYVKDTGK